MRFFRESDAGRGRLPGSRSPPPRSRDPASIWPPNFQGQPFCFQPASACPRSAGSEHRIMSVQVPPGMRVTLCGGWQLRRDLRGVHGVGPDPAALGAAARSARLSAGRWRRGGPAVPEPHAAAVGAPQRRPARTRRRACPNCELRRTATALSPRHARREPRRPAGARCSTLRRACHAGDMSPRGLRYHHRATPRGRAHWRRMEPLELLPE